MSNIKNRSITMAKKKKEVVEAVVEAKAISKKELVSLIAEDSEYMEEAIKDITNEIFAKITQLLAEEKEVSIYSFGTFSIKDTAARKGRNPKTGEVIDIPAGKRAAFKFSNAVKNAIKNNE